MVWWNQNWTLWPWIVALYDGKCETMIYCGETTVVLGLLGRLIASWNLLSTRIVNKSVASINGSFNKVCMLKSWTCIQWFSTSFTVSGFTPTWKAEWSIVHYVQAKEYKWASSPSVCSLVIDYRKRLNYSLFIIQQEKMNRKISWMLTNSTNISLNITLCLN